MSESAWLFYGLAGGWIGFSALVSAWLISGVDWSWIRYWEKWHDDR